MLLSAKLLASTDKQNQNQKKQPQKIRKIYKQHQIQSYQGQDFSKNMSVTFPNPQLAVKLSTLPFNIFNLPEVIDWVRV